LPPIYLKRGRGCRVWDVDGNEYIDLGMGLWAITLGYNYPDHTRVIQQQAEEGVTFTLMHPLEVELAERLVDIIPCAGSH
jgi:glutamate-1-semialdehyde aminotransferase